MSEHLSLYWCFHVFVMFCFITEPMKSETLLIPNVLVCRTTWQCLLNDSVVTLNTIKQS